MADNRSTQIPDGEGDKAKCQATGVGSQKDADDEEASSSTGVQKERDLDTMFDHLEIGEDEFDDFIIAEDDPVIVEGARWLAVGRVHCAKKFSHEDFFNQMQYAWNPAREVLSLKIVL
jgi:hypothetical protein